MTKNIFNKFSIPTEIVSLIYEFDPTYSLIYSKTMIELNKCMTFVDSAYYKILEITIWWFAYIPKPFAQMGIYPSEPTFDDKLIRRHPTSQMDDSVCRNRIYIADHRVNERIYKMHVINDRIRKRNIDFFKHKCIDFNHVRSAEFRLEFEI